MSQTKTIKITCQGADTLPLDLIEGFQGNLKKLSEENQLKIENLIIKQGFSFPIDIWVNPKGKYKIINGHQRTKGLLSLRDKGYEIPAIPVCYIHADTKKEAKEKVLSSTAQFGEFDLDELTSWVDDLDDDIRDLLRFKEKEINLWTEPIEDDEEEEFSEPQGLKINITCNTQDQVKEIAQYLLDKDVSFKIKL